MDFSRLLEEASIEELIVLGTLIKQAEKNDELDELVYFLEKEAVEGVPLWESIKNFMEATKSRSAGETFKAMGQRIKNLFPTSARKSKVLGENVVKPLGEMTMGEAAKVYGPALGIGAVGAGGTGYMLGRRSRK